jgi:Flp pilus assembly protein TadD
MPRWHYAVVVGYDLPRKRILMHSGEAEHMSLSIDTFEHTWARGGHWAIAVTDPSRPPRTATEAEAERAAVALERSDAAAAAIAYEAVLRRWPDNRLAMFGSANLRYAAGDTEGAIAGFRDAVSAHPDFADAWNNLAVALGRAGRATEARAAADRAVALGGPHAATYVATRATLPD